MPKPHPLDLIVLLQEAKSYENQAASIKEALEYADGPAYYNDKERMERALKRAHSLHTIYNFCKEVLNADQA